MPSPAPMRSGALTFWRDYFRPSRPPVAPVPPQPVIVFAQPDLLKEKETLTIGPGGKRGVWRTIGGNPIFVMVEKGQSVPEAIREAQGKAKGQEAAPSIQKSAQRAWTGESRRTKAQPSKQTVGKLAEGIATAWLRAQGARDAGPLNVTVNNFPLDLVHDHEVVEVKAGLVSNGPDAQKWRATLGEPGKLEAAWLREANPARKAAWNAKKQALVLQRKEAAAKAVEKVLGRKIRRSTVALIVDPDRKVADLYRFEGFHASIRWKSPEAAKAYVGSVKFAAKFVAESLFAGEGWDAVDGPVEVPPEVAAEFDAALAAEARAWARALLARLRGVGNGKAAAFAFDPAEHPRDEQGRFIETVSGRLPGPGSSPYVFGREDDPKVKPLSLSSGEGIELATIYNPKTGQIGFTDFVEYHEDMFAAVGVPPKYWDHFARIRVSDLGTSDQHTWVTPPYTKNPLEEKRLVAATFRVLERKGIKLLPGKIEVQWATSVNEQRFGKILTKVFSPTKAVLDAAVASYRPDYVRIERTLDDLQAQLLPRLQRVFRDAKDKIKSLVARRIQGGGLDFRFVEGLELRGLGDLVPLLRAYLHSTFLAGRREAGSELGRLLTIRQSRSFFHAHGLLVARLKTYHEQTVVLPDGQELTLVDGDPGHGPCVNCGYVDETRMGVCFGCFLTSGDEPMREWEQKLFSQWLVENPGWPRAGDWRTKEYATPVDPLKAGETIIIGPEGKRGVWRTIGGNPIFIEVEKGKSVPEAVRQAEARGGGAQVRIDEGKPLLSIGVPAFDFGKFSEVRAKELGKVLEKEQRSLNQLIALHVEVPSSFGLGRSVLEASVLELRKRKGLRLSAEVIGEAARQAKQRIAFTQWVESEGGKKSTILLYRGLQQIRPQKVDIKNPKFGPISSWTTSRSVAKEFAYNGVVVEADVPIKNLLLSSRTSRRFGTRGEGEYLVQNAGVKLRRVTSVEIFSQKRGQLFWSSPEARFITKVLAMSGLPSVLAVVAGHAFESPGSEGKVVPYASSPFLTATDPYGGRARVPLTPGGTPTTVTPSLVRPTLAPPEQVPPTEAINYFEDKAFAWKSILADDLLADIKRVLLGSITTGEPPQETYDALERVFGPYVGDLAALPDQEQTQPYRLETLVRTNSTEAFNQGRKDAFADSAADGFITGYEFSAVLDTRTTQVCRFLDGKILPPEGEKLDRLSPPRHYNCRSILSAIPRTEDPAPNFISDAEFVQGIELSGEGFSEQAKARAYTTGSHGFSSTQLDLPAAAQDRLRAWVQANVRLEELSPDESQDDVFHVTVLYGIHAVDGRQVAEAAVGFGPVTFRLGAVAVFDTNPEYDVLILPVLDAVDLRLLRGRLEKLPHTKTHAKYRPHVTLAYVKKGAGRRLLDQPSPVEGPITVDRLRFTSWRAGAGATWVSLLPRAKPYAFPLEKLLEKMA